MTEDDKALVEALRIGDYYPDGDIGYHEISPGKVDALCEEAADRIEQLTAEVERLRDALIEIETGECVTDLADQPHEQMQSRARAALEGKQ